MTFGLWGAYAMFVALAVLLCRHEPLFDSSGPYAAGKLIAWAAWAAFTGFSAYCSRHENLFVTIGRIWRMHWGRQIGLDLYLGLAIFLFVVFLHEGAPVMLLWLAPALAFVNLATLLYVALHYDALVARFVG